MENDSTIDLDKMPLNLIEKVLKDFYRCCPESTLPCSGAEMLERYNKALGHANTPWMLDARDVRGVDHPIDSDNRKEQDLRYVKPSGKSMLTGIDEELYMRDEWNVAVSRNHRYASAVYHQHSFFEMIYVTAGRCKLHFPDMSVALN